MACDVSGASDQTHFTFDRVLSMGLSMAFDGFRGRSKHCRNFEDSGTMYWNSSVGIQAGSNYLGLTFKICDLLLKFISRLRF